LLECPDAELFDWINARALPAPEYDHDVTRLLLAFRYTPRAT
jgi:succinate dehydrogenase flavin-adding protein (antitoxin of CptAB toxin-antitoxin module)